MPTVNEYQELIAGGCPYCGESLIIRKGKYGEFIACSERCGYTKSISGRSEYPPPKALKQVCPYKKCDGSGLIPFEKNGKIIPYTHVFCDCHPQYGIDVRERYSAIQPEDYDFPMSSDFRAFTYQYCGVPDPGYVPPEPLETTKPPEPAPTEAPMVYHHRPHSHTYTRKQAGRLFLRMESLENDMKGFKEYLKKKEAEKIQEGKKKDEHLYR